MKSIPITVTHDVIFARLCALALIGVLLVTGCSPKPQAKKSPTHDSFRHSMYPIAPKEQNNFLETESAKVTEAEQATPVLQEQLRQLAQYINQSAGEAPKLPGIFNSDVEIFSLDREQFTSGYRGDRIRVARWRLSDKTPRQFGEVGVDSLVKTLVEPWEDSSSFRIEFQISKIATKTAYFDVEVLTEMNGQVDETTGRSATGLWEIRWHKNRRAGGQLRIDRIKMRGHEELVAYVEGGVLLRDCTASVLRHDEKLIDGLSKSMDVWAKDIPGADLLGQCGLSLGDVNRDGLDDIYVCQPHGMPNLLLVQNPDGTADNMATQMGVDVMDHSYASLIVDVDNDGDQDLVVATDEALVMFSNNGRGGFQLEHQMRIGRGCQSLSAADFDQDGDLDFYLTKYRPTWNYNDIFPHPNQRMESENGGRNVLLRNDEAWKFVDVTSQVGLGAGNNRYSTSSVWTDFDVDGDLDLFVTNEFHSDCYYENKDGWLAKQNEGPMAYEPGLHSTVSTGCFSNDSKPDLLVGTNVSFETSRFINEYLSYGGRYADEAKGVAAAGRYWVLREGKKFPSKMSFPQPIFSFNSSFSSAVADLNNDSLDDILITNGWLTREGKGNLDWLYQQNKYNIPIAGDEKDPPSDRRFKNEISDLCRKGYSFSGFQRNRCLLQIEPERFSNFSPGSGFDFLDDARGIATTDWDWDGDVDVVVTCRTAPRIRILQNQIESNNGYLTVKLTGTKSNRDAIGSRLELYVEGRKLPIVKTITAGSGRASQSSKDVVFGMGQWTTIDKLVIWWPNGEQQTVKGLSRNMIYSIVEGRNEAAEVSNKRSKVAIASKPIPKAGNGKEIGSAVFYPTTRLPIMEFQGTREKWFTVSQLPGMLQLIVFCPFDDQAVQRVLDWQNTYQDVVDSDVDLLPLFYHSDMREQSLFNRAQKKISSSKFGFRWGTLAPSSRDKLGLVFGDMFCSVLDPSQPVAVLLDDRGRVHRAFVGDEFNWKNIKPHCKEIRLQTKSDVESQPKQGNWLARYRLPKLDRIKLRVKELGYARDAEHYEKFVNDQTADAYFNRAWELSSEGNLPEAAQFAEKSLSFNPRFVPALVGSARIAQKQAMESDPQYRIQLLREAGRRLDDALELDPANSEAIIARADVYYLLKDTERAIEVLKQYLEINPKEWQVHAMIGRLFAKQREYVKATEYLVTAFDNRPTLPNVAGELGYLYFRSGQFDDARRFLRLASRLQPSDPMVARRVSEAEFWSGNLEDTTELFRKSVALYPRERQLKYYLAWVLATSPFESKRNGREAIEIIEPLAKMHENESAFVLEIKAAALAEAGKFEQAAAEQLKALEMVDNENAAEVYTDQQLEGLEERLELYRRAKPYRMSDTQKDNGRIPFAMPKLR